MLLVGTLVYFAFIRSMPGLIAALKSGRESEIEDYLRNSNNARGLLCTALLQVLQVISVVFPGGAVQMAAGIVYGALRGFVVCHLAETFAHSVVFFSARNLGATVNRIAPAGDKASKLDFIKRSGHPTYMTAVAYLIPVLPNGIIPYVAAGTRITFLHFVLAVYVGTFFPTLVACAAGSYIIEGSYFAAVLILALLGLAAFLLWRYRDAVLELLSRAMAKLSASRAAQKKKLDGCSRRAIYRVCGITITEATIVGFVSSVKWIIPAALVLLALLRLFGVVFPKWLSVIALLLLAALYLSAVAIEKHRDRKK